MTGVDSVDRPNVEIIVSDDQGYGDLSCMGATDFRTPRLDALARSGVRANTRRGWPAS